MPKKYQAIIIGAGPSGLATAINLKKLGIDKILVIEQYKFPRYKCCAGYITNKTKQVYEDLGLNIDECHYSLIKDFSIFYKFNLKQMINNIFLYTNEKIDRVELDNNFFKLAKSKGVEIREKTTIKKHDVESNEILLSNKEKLEYEYLVFADGTQSFSSRYQKIKNKNIAMQVTFPTTIKDSIQIHFGITKKGYAWVSSYKGITNVGITDQYNPNINYNNIFKNFLNELNLKCNSKDIKGAFTPIGVRKGLLNKNIYFVGDAVGACDPLTLSGLRYGLKSGEICAKSIALNKPSVYKRYLKILNIRFKIMTCLAQFFYMKVILFLIFNVGCRYFSKVISFIFNHFFVNKK